MDQNQVSNRGLFMPLVLVLVSLVLLVSINWLILHNHVTKSINTYPNPSWRKEIMNEEATTVQANHPPSGFSESQECCRPNVTVRVSGFSLSSWSSSSNVTFCWSCWLVISVVKGHTTNSQLSIQGDFSTSSFCIARGQKSKQKNQPIWTMRSVVHLLPIPFFGLIIKLLFQ